MDPAEPTVADIGHPPSGSPASSGRQFQALLGYVVAVACLVWVFHDIRPAGLLPRMIRLNWGWAAAAVFFDIIGYLCQGWRWQLLLRPVGKLSVVRTSQAIYVGLFTNEVLPLRFGELVRAYLAARWIPADFVAIIPSMAVERLFDGVWLALGIGLAAIFVPLPEDLLEAGDLLGVIVILATALFLYIVFRKRSVKSRQKREYLSRWKLWQWLNGVTIRFAEGLRGIGTSGTLFRTFTLTLFFLGCQVLAFWFAMLAYDLRYSIWVGALVFLIVHLGTAIPNAPANVGTFQFFTVVGLTFFGVDKTLATGFSVVVFMLLTIPLWVIGFLALSRSGMTLRSLQEEIRRLIQT
jgi:glycosyltransferase 2 family protein